MDDFETYANDPQELGGFDETGSLPPEEGEEAAESSPTQEGTETEGEASPEEGAEPWRALLQDGETPEEALLRVESIRAESAGRAAAHWREIKEMKDSIRQLTKENSAAQKILEMLNEAQAETERQAQAAQEPDPDLDPEGWQRHQLRRQEEKIDRLERILLEHRQQEEERAKAAQEEGQIEAVDVATFQEVNGLLGIDGSGGDPEFREDWDLVFKLTVEGLRAEYPEATDDQLLEAFNGLLVATGRAASSRGSSLADHVRQRAEAFRRATGIKRQAQSNGKGGKAPTPAEIQRAAEKQKKAKGVRRISGGTGGSTTASSLSEFAELDEEQQVALLRSGKATVDDEELWRALRDEINN